MDYEPITKELRELMSHQAVVGTDTFKSRVTADHDAFDAACDNIDAIHRSLEQENERLRDASESGDGWIKLPVDADDVPVREGDELWSDNGIRVKVERLQFENGKWAVFVEDKAGVGFYAAFEIMHHYNPDTWESILADAMGCEPNEVAEDDDLMALVARCEALCERTREGEE